jgi:hypothetical protein
MSRYLSIRSPRDEKLSGIGGGMGGRGWGGGHSGHVSGSPPKLCGLPAILELLFNGVPIGLSLCGQLPCSATIVD